jgi:hypothetical protein
VAVGSAATAGMEIQINGIPGRGKTASIIRERQGQAHSQGRRWTRRGRLPSVL